jgi:hypothetical protein
MQIGNKRGREGSDAVVGKVASQHNQADEGQDGEAVGTAGGMEETQGIGANCVNHSGIILGRFKAIHSGEAGAIFVGVKDTERR